jgi:hypothetical protein
MGFSWSFYFAQPLHEQKLISSGLDPSRFLVSSWPAPPVGDSCIALPYCDNLIIFGKCPDTVNQCLKHVMSSFSEIGFELHEIEYATPFTTTLGAQLDGSRHMVRPRPERVWVLREAFRWAASGVRISGQQLEVLLGHYVHEALFSRPALSVFRACYSFTRDSYYTQQRLWKSACHECLVACGIFPVITAQIGRPWSDIVVATDASPTGWGICAAKVDSEVARSMVFGTTVGAFGACGLASGPPAVVPWTRGPIRSAT